MKFSDVFLYLAVALAFLIGACTKGGFTEPQARDIAQREFTKTCAVFHYNTDSFTGPIKTGVGRGALFAYQWREKTPGSDFGLLVSIDKDGIPHIAFLGKIPGMP